jgi:hypothetical protein
MTPFDDAKPAPTDPGETKPAPNDPGDELDLALSVRYRDQVIERQQKRIHALEVEVKRYRNRERQMHALIEQYNRLERERVREQLHTNSDHEGVRIRCNFQTGLGGTGQCDCTMERSAYLHEPPGLRAVIEAALHKMMG